MIIVKIIGGLGNQMFQYAFGYSLSKQNNEILKLDIKNFKKDKLRHYELNLYKIKEYFASEIEIEKLKYKQINLFKKTLGLLRLNQSHLTKSHYNEPHYHFDKNVFQINGDIYFDGYWQSYKYFQNYNNDILKIFIPKNKIHYKSETYKQKIMATKSVSLHIRRGDYVSNKVTNKVHGICDLQYYYKAMSLLKSRVPNVHLFIFSDDLNWAKKNLNSIHNITYVELSKNIPNNEEIYLMSKCKHNIIANSTFSWWGAWLNQNPNKIVIAPKQWFQDLNTYNTKDLLPTDWLQL